MIPRAYYNEFDPKAASWLRELIAAREIMDGDVDERSISDVQSSDLTGYTRCHFFAGIGGWDYALRLAGWPDDRPVWTGSCPYQPFSAAGEQGGTADPRHLWPVWERLVRECRPATVFGEQVASAIGHGWLDLVCDDLEREDYAIGAVVLPAASVGAPHKRDRLWFVAYADHAERGADVARGDERNGSATGRDEGDGQPRSNRDALELAHATNSNRGSGERGAEAGTRQDAERGRGSSSSGDDGGLGDTGYSRLQGREQRGPRHDERDGTDAHGSTAEPGGSFWADCDWLPCRDGKFRPVEPGTFPLAHGLPARVGRLRGYGNAIVPPLAAKFIQAFALIEED